jgi:hypothetical protein
VLRRSGVALGRVGLWWRHAIEHRGNTVPTSGHGDVALALGSSGDLILGESGWWRSDMLGHKKGPRGAL